MQNSKGQVYKPSELLNSLRESTIQYMDGGQHDSHELLRHLLEEVRSEDLRVWYLKISLVI
jgi:ubiquitin carboxyl-terminal hydrolase 16/45